MSGVTVENPHGSGVKVPPEPLIPAVQRGEPLQLLLSCEDA